MLLLVLLLIQLLLLVELMLIQLLLLLEVLLAQLLVLLVLLIRLHLGQLLLLLAECLILLQVGNIPFNHFDKHLAIVTKIGQWHRDGLVPSTSTVGKGRLNVTANKLGLFLDHPKFTNDQDMVKSWYINMLITTYTKTLPSYKQENKQNV